MKPLLCFALLLLTFSLNAQAPTAVPIPKEPHHHLVLENDYVRVFRVSVPAHEATLLHQHDVPYLYVSLGPANVINAVQGKPETHLVMADGQLGYSPGHFAHIARNESDLPFNNVTIELLKPQDEPHNRCAKIIDAPLNACPQSELNRDAIAMRSMRVPVPVFETDELLIEAHLVEANGTAWTKTAGPEPARLLISLGDVKLKVGSSDQMWTNMHPGDDIWIQPGAHLSVVNQSQNTNARFLVFAFKDSAITKKP
jgi:hypothetical protein